MRIWYVLAVLSLFPFARLCAEGEGTLAALHTFEGNVEVREIWESAAKPVRAGMVFHAGDVILTGSASRAGIAFANGGFLRLGENSALEFKPDPAGGDTKRIGLSEGKGYYFSRDPRKSPIVDTPSASLAIRGTEFAVEVVGERTTVAMLDGAVECSNAQGAVTLAKGEGAVVDRGRAPVKTILVRPLDAVQWALYYPQLPMHAASARVKEAASLISKGDVAQADAILRNEAAANDTAEAAPALALRSIIALAKNDKDDAASLSLRASQLAPKSPAAMLARSYVAQGFFDLQGARKFAIEASKDEYSRPAALARLAELAMGSGELTEAISYAQEAVRLEPSNPYIRNVFGFSKLLQSRNEEALAEFRIARELAPGDAQGLFGEGLALIHSGDLAGGRRALEEASFLSPNVSIYRSYLGKAYFEEEDERRAAHEYDRAISLDPLDPTPFLYRAFSELSANDPVAALKDVQRSIELNHNRAVYRSSSLLDQDIGVRTAGLSKVFTELGFTRAGQVEAIKSLSKDYSNYSAHLLLADSYQSVFFNDASQSERMIADLLAPLNFNLFQHAAGQATFNQYDALFDRPDERTEISGIVSSYDDILAPAGQHAAKGEEWAYGIGMEPVIGRGTKHGSHFRQYTGNIKASYQPLYSDRFSLAGKWQYARTFDQQGDSSDARLEGGRAELGYLHTFDARSKLVTFASFNSDYNRYIVNGIPRPAGITEIWEGELNDFEDELIVDELSRERIQTAKAGAQHVLDTSLVSTIVGAEYHYSRVHRRENSAVNEDGLGYFEDINYFIRTRGYNDVNASDVYAYSIWHLLPEADLTLGGTYSFVQVEDREVAPFEHGTKLFNRFNPKVGLTLYPLASLTFRGAYFEGLRKSILEDAVSIEPTLVGGINQRFSDYSGTQARNIGAGVDYKPFQSTYFGLEGTMRKVRNTLLPAESWFIFDYDEGTLDSAVVRGDREWLYQNQNFVKGYLSQVVTERIAANLEYDYAQFESTDPVRYQDVRLNKLAMNARYFDPSGFYPYSTAAWRHQKRIGSDFYEDGSSDFWTVDVGLGYRLPKRHGSVALQVSNIFDRDFTYDQSFGAEPFVFSGVGVGLITTINF